MTNIYEEKLEYKTIGNEEP